MSNVEAGSVKIDWGSVRNAAGSNYEGEYFQDGDYDVVLTAVKTWQNKFDVKFFGVEARIVTSTNPNLPPGTLGKQIIKLDKEVAYLNVKEFAMAATGCPADELDDVGLAAMVTAEQPLVGTFMRLNVITPMGKVYSKKKWKLIPEGATGNLVKLAKELGIKF